MSYKLSEEELSDVEKILESYYMVPVLSRIEAFSDYKKALDNLHEIITSSNPEFRSEFRKNIFKRASWSNL